MTELKNRLSEYLRLVKRGERIEVLERAHPIARIEAVRPGPGDGAAGLDQLVFEGLVERARRRPDRSFLDEPPVECDADAVQVLIDQRGDR